MHMLCRFPLHMFRSRRAAAYWLHVSVHTAARVRSTPLVIQRFEHVPGVNKQQDRRALVDLVLHDLGTDLGRVTEKLRLVAAHGRRAAATVLGWDAVACDSTRGIRRAFNIRSQEEMKRRLHP